MFVGAVGFVLMSPPPSLGGVVLPPSLVELGAPPSPGSLVVGGVDGPGLVVVGAVVGVGEPLLLVAASEDEQATAARARSGRTKERMVDGSAVAAPARTASIHMQFPQFIEQMERQTGRAAPRLSHRFGSPSLFSSAVRRVLTVMLTVLAAGCWLTKSNDELDCTKCGDAGATIDASGTVVPDSSSPLPEASTADPCPSAYFCANFESGLGPFQESSESLSNGTLTIDPSQHAHGTSSIKAQITPGPSPSAFLEETQTLGADSYWRMFVYVPTGPAKTTSDPDFFAQAVLNTPNNDTVSLRIDGANQGTRALEIGDSIHQLYTPSNTPFPFDQWACIEWHIGPTGMQVWLNDSELTDAATAGSLKSAIPIQEFLGTASPNGLKAASNSLTLWMDEIVVAKSRVGCAAFQQ